MANYALVHGAWGGGQTFDQTKVDLEGDGHNVLVASLRGLGTRQSELHPGITLTDHIADVVDQIEASDFKRFILVGHSYGGMVAAGVAALMGKRIDAICYIDAFLPGDGQSLWDISGEFERNWFIDQQKNNPGLVPMLGASNFEPVEGVVGYHPLLTLLEAVRMTGAEQTILRKCYVSATGYEPSPFRHFAQRAKAQGWEYHEVDCGHIVMNEMPEVVRDILLGLAS